MRGVVVCPEPPAARAGAHILAKGGNAFDAAVAAAFAQGVTNPLGCGLGGHACVQLYAGPQDVGIYLNGSVAIGSGAGLRHITSGAVPRSERVGRYLIPDDLNQLGYTSIMIPGFTAALGELAGRFGSGRVAWRELVLPAQEFAAGGFEVYPYLHSYYTFEGPDKPGYPDLFRKLRQDDAARALYLPNGTPPPVGYVLRQPDMAATLAKIADRGADDFYRGAVAREIARDLDAHEASVTGADLASYTVRTEMPIVAKWRGLTIQTSTPPTRGAVLIAMLRAVEGVDLPALGFNSAAYIDLLARATNRAFADGAAILADPAYTSVAVERLLSRTRPAVPVSRPAQPRRDDRHTTHVTAADADGNVVSITHSIGSVTGAGVITPGLGFFYNNFLGHFNPAPGRHDSIAAGKRGGGGCPTIIFRDGRPVFAIGSSGGSRLVSAVFQSILNVFVHGMDPQEAVSAPRFHCEEDGRIYMEPAIGAETAAALKRMGYEVETASYMGCNQAVLLSGNSLIGGSDPRGGQGIGQT